MTWDTIQIIFWTITYLLAIIYAIKYKHHIIPWPAMFLNMSWETAALLKYRSILHIPWFLLDMALVILFLFSHHERRSTYMDILYSADYSGIPKTIRVQQLYAVDIFPDGSVYGDAFFGHAL